MAIFQGSLAFQEQINFFRGKTDLPTRAWTDVYTAEYDWAFVVAGAAKRDLLANLRGAFEKSIVAGGTLEQFGCERYSACLRHGRWDGGGEPGWTV